MRKTKINRQFITLLNIYLQILSYEDGIINNNITRDKKKTHLHSRIKWCTDLRAKCLLLFSTYFIAYNIYNTKGLGTSYSTYVFSWL